MTQDYRTAFIKSVEQDLIYTLDADKFALVIDTITKRLNDYELSERCTDLLLLDDSNTKLIKRYCACLLVDGKSECTIYQYSRTIRRFSDFINKPFTEVGQYDLRFFLACEKDRGISNRTLENTRSYLSSFFTWLTDEDVIIKNPASQLKPIKYVREIKLPFSEVEIDTLRNNCRDLRERAMMEFLLSSGVRVSELASIEIQDINFAELSVHVRHGKGGKERTTYITAVSANHLQKYLSTRCDNSSYLFVNRYGRRFHVSGIRDALHRIAARAGVSNVHPHRFRRTFATNAAKRGLEVQEIQVLLGHSNINTTMGYIYMDNENVKLAYKKHIV